MPPDSNSNQAGLAARWSTGIKDVSYKFSPVTKILSSAHTIVGAFGAVPTNAFVSNTLHTIGASDGVASWTGMTAGAITVAAGVGSSAANAMKEAGGLRAMIRGGHRVRNNETRLGIERKAGYDRVAATESHATEYNDGIQSYRSGFVLNPNWSEARKAGFNEACDKEGNSRPDEFVAWCDGANAADPATPDNGYRESLEAAPWITSLTAAPNAPPTEADEESDRSSTEREQGESAVIETSVLDTGDANAAPERGDEIERNRSEQAADRVDTENAHVHPEEKSEVGEGRAEADQHTSGRHDAAEVQPETTEPDPEAAQAEGDVSRRAQAAADATKSDSRVDADESATDTASALETKAEVEAEANAQNEAETETDADVEAGADLNAPRGDALPTPGIADDVAFDDSDTYSSADRMGAGVGGGSADAIASPTSQPSDTENGPGADSEESDDITGETSEPKDASTTAPPSPREPEHEEEDADTDMDW